MEKHAKASSGHIFYFNKSIVAAVIHITNKKRNKLNSNLFFK